jgi:hypothetical protein
MVKYLSFQNSSFALRCLFNVNGEATVWHTPCFPLLWKGLGISGREVHLFKRHWQVLLWGRPSPFAFNMFFGQGRHLSLTSLHLTTFVLHCCQKSTIICKVCVVDGMTLHGVIMKHGSKPVCGPSRTFIRILFFLFLLKWGWQSCEKSLGCSLCVECWRF